MGYTLCSSSEEEPGEIKNIPQTILIDTSLIYTNKLFDNGVFVGPNKQMHTNRIAFSETKQEYIKNRIRRTVPYSNVLVFFKTVEEVLHEMIAVKTVEAKKIENFKLKNVISKVCLFNTNKFNHTANFSDSYREFYSSFSVNFKSNFEAQEFSNIVIVSDLILNLQPFPIKFIVSRIGNSKITILKNCIFSSLNFLEAIKIYGVAVVAATHSVEIRSYVFNNTLVYVFSESVLICNSGEKRILDSLDKKKNCGIFCDEENIKIVDSQNDCFKLNNELVSYLTSLDVESGEYVFKNGSIFVENETVIENSCLDFDLFK